MSQFVFEDEIQTPTPRGMFVFEPEQPPPASTWRDRIFKTGQETLADPNATAIERFLAGITTGGRQALTQAIQEPDIPKGIGTALAAPFSAVSQGVLESGMATPRTVEELGKLMMALTPVWTAPRLGRPMRTTESLRAQEPIAEAPRTVRPTPEPGMPPAQPVESPVSPAARPMPTIPEPLTAVAPEPAIPEVIRQAVEPVSPRVPQELQAGPRITSEGPPPVEMAPPSAVQVPAPESAAVAVPEPAIPEAIRQAIEPTRPAELTGVAVGDVVSYRRRLREEPITGRVTNVNADGTVNVRVKDGRILRSLPPERVTPVRPAEPVGLESQKIGGRIALSGIDAEILGEMKQTAETQRIPEYDQATKRYQKKLGVEASSAAGTGEGGKIFRDVSQESRDLQGPEVIGWKTSKPPWMEIPDKPGKYHNYADVLEAIESLERGEWPGTALQQRIAEQLLQEVRFDAEEEKGRIGAYRARAEEAAPTAKSVAPGGTEEALQEAFFAEVDRLVAEEATKINRGRR